jgi:hypothetical protein
MRVLRKDEAMTMSRSPSWRAVALLALAAPATTPSSLAAECLPADVFAGYSFMQLEDVDRHGVNLALSFSLAGSFGGFVDSSAHWSNQAWRGRIHRTDLTLMAGPGVRLGKRGGLAFFLRGLVGLVTDRASYPEWTGAVAHSDSRLGAMAGGGVELAIGSRLALRAQGDCLWREAPGRSQPTVAGSPGPVPRIVGTPAAGPSSQSTSFRVSAGLVYRFGAL